MKIKIISMEGIGDCIYQRPFVKKLVEEGNDVYIATFLHELYSDIKGLKFLKPSKQDTYRTQQKQTSSQSKIEYSDETEFDKVINPLYRGEDLIHDSIVFSMAEKFGVTDVANLSWDLPDLSKHNEQHWNILKHIPFGLKKIAVVRPSTIRKEWEVSTRSPDPTYLYWCSHVLREFGYYVISIADLEKDQEWIETPVPYSDLQLHSGELGVYGTLDLLRFADIVVGGSGFIVPAAVSARANLFVIFGGRGAYDSPYKIFHGSMDLRKVGWAVPKNFCRCTLAKHNCDKSIPDLDDKFMTFIRQTQYDSNV